MASFSTPFAARRRRCRQVVARKTTYIRIFASTTMSCMFGTTTYNRRVVYIRSTAMTNDGAFPALGASIPKDNIAAVVSDPAVRGTHSR